MAISEAIERHLASMLTRTPRCGGTPEEMVDRIGDVVAWTTWADIATTAADRAAHIDSRLEPSVAESLRRLSTAVTDAVERHG